MNRNTKSFTTALLAVCWLTVLGAAEAAKNKAEVVVHAAENLKMVSQQIPKAYFYIQQGLRVEKAKENIADGMSHLDRDIKTLAGNVRDEDGKSLLLFLSFTRDELRHSLEGAYTKEQGALMLDFGESLLEGAESIAHSHMDAGKKVHMSVVVEDMLFLLERAAKYYIAFRAGFNDYNNIEQQQRAIASFETNLARVNAYKNYPDSLKHEIAKINKYWPIAKRFYLGIEKSNLPVIVFTSTEYLEKSLSKLESFHVASN